MNRKSTCKHTRRSSVAACKTSARIATPPSLTTQAPRGNTARPNATEKRRARESPPTNAAALAQEPANSANANSNGNGAQTNIAKDDSARTYAPEDGQAKTESNVTKEATAGNWNTCTGNDAEEPSSSHAASADSTEWSRSRTSSQPQKEEGTARKTSSGCALTTTRCSNGCNSTSRRSHSCQNTPKLHTNQRP